MTTQSSLKVSIVTPAYNQAHFLATTIESVLGQDYSNIEYFVIDDGSTDNTLDVLHRYSGRIRWDTHTNRGQTSTINKGWEVATGDVLAWLNSDDTLIPGAISQAVDFLNNHPEVGIVFGDTLFTDESGDPLRRTGPQINFDYNQFVINCVNPIPQPSAFIRRSVFERTGCLDPRFRYFMDWDYWLRAGLITDIVYVPEVWSTYRLHFQSNTVANTAKYTPELEYMYHKFLSRVDIPKNLRQSSTLAMANMYFTSGGYYLRSGEKSKARQMVYKALHSYPALLLSPTMLHKSAYCLFGTSQPYIKLRQLFRSTVEKSSVLS